MLKTMNLCRIQGLPDFQNKYPSSFKNNKILIQLIFSKYLKVSLFEPYNMSREMFKENPNWPVWWWLGLTDQMRGNLGSERC